MNKKKNDLISRKRILYELGESNMPKQYRDFCIRVINDINLTPSAIMSPSEDLRDWIVDYWFEVEDNINFAISEYLQDNEFDSKDDVDRDNLGTFISDVIQIGILNVIDTYEEEV